MDAESGSVGGEAGDNERLEMTGELFYEFLHTEKK